MVTVSHVRTGNIRDLSIKQDTDFSKQTTLTCRKYTCSSLWFQIKANSGFSFCNSDGVLVLSFCDSEGVLGLNRSLNCRGVLVFEIQKGSWVIKVN